MLNNVSEIAAMPFDVAPCLLRTGIEDHEHTASAIGSLLLSLSLIIAHAIGG
jgi:hypothetical protein